MDELYIELARQLPPRPMTAYTTIAQAFLSGVLSKAVSHVDDQNLQAECAGWLADASAQLSKMIRFDQAGQ